MYRVRLFPIYVLCFVCLSECLYNVMYMICLGCIMLPPADGCRVGGQRIRCDCYNQVMVACLRSRSSKHKGLMHLLCILVFVEAHFGFQFYHVYVDKQANHLADDLSRNNCFSFLSKVLHARRTPSLVLPPLFNLLLIPLAD